MLSYTEEELKKLYKKYKISAKKFDGDDAYSWHIFVNSIPKYYGRLTKDEVPYYKKRVLEILMKRT